MICSVRGSDEADWIGILVLMSHSESVCVRDDLLLILTYGAVQDWTMIT